MSTTTMTTATLDVPGAMLYYQVRGAGPVLMMICGGIYDADLLADLAERLADRFTVVTYDRRGNSRSPLAGPPVPQRIEVRADDAHRLSSAVAGRRPLARCHPGRAGHLPGGRSRTSHGNLRCGDRQVR